MGSLVGRRFRSARAARPLATGSPNRRVGPVVFDHFVFDHFDPFFVAAGDDGHQGRRGRGPRRQRPHRVAPPFSPLALVPHIRASIELSSFCAPAGCLAVLYILCVR